MSTNLKNNVYGQTLVLAAIAVANGDTTSEHIDCGRLANAGVASPRRLSLPDNFPATTITFETADDIGEDVPGDFKPYYVADGVDSIRVGITTVGGFQDISVPAYWFDSVRFIRMVLADAAEEDLIFNLALEPIYQGGA